MSDLSFVHLESLQKAIFSGDVWLFLFLTINLSHKEVLHKHNFLCYPQISQQSCTSCSNGSRRKSKCCQHHHHMYHRKSYQYYPRRRPAVRQPKRCTFAMPLTSTASDNENNVTTMHHPSSHVTCHRESSNSSNASSIRIIE